MLNSAFRLLPFASRIRVASNAHNVRNPDSVHPRIYEQSRAMSVERYTS